MPAARSAGVAVDAASNPRPNNSKPTPDDDSPRYPPRPERRTTKRPPGSSDQIRLGAGPSIAPRRPAVRVRLAPCLGNPLGYNENGDFVRLAVVGPRHRRVHLFGRGTVVHRRLMLSLGL